MIILGLRWDLSSIWVRIKTPQRGWENKEISIQVKERGLEKEQWTGTVRILLNRVEGKRILKSQLPKVYMVLAKGKWTSLTEWYLIMR